MICYLLYYLLTCVHYLVMLTGNIFYCNIYFIYYIRYAVSVLWRLSSDLEVEKVWYGRSVINSKYKLTYEVAQKLFEDEDTAKIVSLISELKGTDLLHEELEIR